MMITPSCTNNYLPWYFSNQDYPPLCTSSGCILQLCKDSLVLVHLFRCLWEIWTNKTDRRTRWSLYIPYISPISPQSFVFRGIIRVLFILVVHICTLNRFLASVNYKTFVHTKNNKSIAESDECSPNVDCLLEAEFVI